eukprot:1726493-Pleurochrysis_carterae.AAC.5
MLSADGDASRHSTSQLVWRFPVPACGIWELWHSCVSSLSLIHLRLRQPSRVDDTQGFQEHDGTGVEMIRIISGNSADALNHHCTLTRLAFCLSDL